MRLPHVLLAVIVAGLVALPSVAQAAPGDLDASFGFGGVVTTEAGRDDYGQDAAVDAAGRTVVVGSSETFSVDQSSMAIARYTKSGVPDTTFGGDGLVVVNLGPQTLDFAKAVAVDPNGRIVIVGASCPDTSECFGVVGARLTAGGQLDPTFGGGDGVAALVDSVSVSDVIIGPSGRIVAAGIHDGDMAVFRLTPDGTFDPSFSGDGIATADFGPGYSYSNGYGLALDSQGRIVVAGEAGGEDVADFAAARFLSGGALDPSFSGDGRVVTDLDSLGNLDYPGGMAVDPNDRVYMVGTSFPSSFSGPWHPALVRYTASGSLDATFGASGVIFGEAYAGGNAIAIDGSERLLVASSGDEDALLRYQSNGALDPSFGGGDGSALVPIGIQEGLTTDPSRRIVVAGSEWNGSDSDLAAARFQSGEPAPPLQTLSVSLGGPGSGSVMAPGISCPSACTESYAEGTPIELLANPGAGSVFAGWSGDCSGTGSCQVTMGTAKTVTARFEPVTEQLPSNTPPPPPPASASPIVPTTRLGTATINGTKRVATFRFSGHGGTALTFQCKLDRGPFKPCRSPKTYRKLKPGQHVFRVRARNALGQTDQTPAVKRFRIPNLRAKHHDSRRARRV